MSEIQKNLNVKNKNNNGLSLIEGVILGMSMIIPGVSGGTILVIFGIYEQLISDILAFNLKPYVLLGVGSILGVLMGSRVLTFLFNTYRDPTLAFILGCILMSVPIILKRGKGHRVEYIGLLIIGFTLSFSLITVNNQASSNGLTTINAIFGGFVSSSAMLIPGVSGSAALIVLGIYESLLKSITNLNFKVIILYLIGAILGFIIMAKIMKRIFKKYEVQILYFFSGMILGSARLLLPSAFSLLSTLTFLVGGILVYRWGSGPKTSG